MNSLFSAYIWRNTILFVCIFSLSINLYATDGIEEALQHKLDAIIAQYDIPGATLAVYYDEDHVISLSSGYADKEENVRMPIGGQMLLGSTGKTFVAAVLLNLVEDGKIKLDEKLLYYFPEERWMQALPEAEKLTIRMLLTHTSGMPRYVFHQAFLQALQEDPQRSFSPQECLEFVMNMEAVHPAGEGWSYSDTNYILLGMLIEKITGQKFYDLLQKQILDPYHLKHTYPSTQAELPGLVQGYIGDRNFFSMPSKVLVDGKYGINPQFEWTGGGLVSNVPDLAKWMKLLHTTDIISKEMHTEMLKVVDFRTGKPAETGYGFANFTWNTDGTISYGHAGMMPGFLTQIEYFPAGDYGMALQINSDQGRKTSLHQLLHELEAVVKEYAVQNK